MFTLENLATIAQALILALTSAERAQKNSRNPQLSVVHEAIANEIKLAQTAVHNEITKLKNKQK